MWGYSFCQSRRRFSPRTWPCGHPDLRSLTFNPKLWKIDMCCLSKKEKILMLNDWNRLHTVWTGLKVWYYYFSIIGCYITAYIFLHHLFAKHFGRYFKSCRDKHPCSQEDAYISRLVSKTSVDTNQEFNLNLGSIMYIEMVRLYGST